MGRPWQKKQRYEPMGKSSRKQKEKSLSSQRTGADLDEFDDDIDKFHKGSEKIPLDVGDDFELSEEEMEEPVFNLKGESDEENESVESDEDDLDDEELSGLAAKIVKQAKILRQKSSLIEDEEVEDEDQDDDQKYKKAPWGKRKRMYYSADNVDYELQSSDEEAPAEEEAEALRLQRLRAESLRLEDFDLSEEDGKEPSLEEDGHTLQEIVERKEANDDEASGHNLLKIRQFGALKGDTKVFVEEVKKDLDLLSKEEKLEVVMSDAPELVGLLAEFREGLEELQSKIEPLLNKAKAGNLVTKEGLQFLETKHMLLLCYCQSILFYLIMKSERRSVQDHPVIARLVEIRLLIEKIQPVEQKLQDQMDKLLRVSTGPSMSREIEKSIYSSDNVKASKQVNVKLAVKPVSKQTTLLEGDKMEDGNLKQRRQDKSWSNNAVKSSPVEVDKGEDAAGIHKLRKSSEQDKILASSESEDDDILPRKKSLHRIISTKVKASKRVGSGDMDLPAREDIGERRAKLEMQKVSSDKNEAQNEEDDDSFELEEDDFYQKAKQLKEAKQAAKELKHKKIEISEPILEPEVGKRHISYQMEKNKGLTPHRKKLTKNPRKKYKLKHQKAVIRRKGQVRAVKNADGPYGGESTGIRTNISRSVRFKS